MAKLFETTLDVCAVCRFETTRPSKVLWVLEHTSPYGTSTVYSRSLVEFCPECSEEVRARIHVAVMTLVEEIREEIWRRENS